MFKVNFLAGLILALFALSAFAQLPDPRDSVIIESKPVGPSTTPPDFSVRVRVLITNKDTITGLVLPLRESTTIGNVYMTLSYPRTFSGVVATLTATLRAVRSFSGGRYNSVSPDTFVIAGFSDSLNLATTEPPNLIRNGFWEIKFDTVFDELGFIDIDSVFISPDTTIKFVGFGGTDIKVNFVRGVMAACFACDTFPTSIDGDLSGNFPKVYYLSQNYPNPFNANTQITFALPKSGRTKLEVFNVLGQKISTLVDEFLTAGTKTVNWDGRDEKGIPVPSGVYFYQLQAAEFRETKKMLVLK